MFVACCTCGRCWVLAVCVTTLDSFAGACLLSIIFKIKSLEDTQVGLVESRCLFPRPARLNGQL